MKRKIFETFLVGDIKFCHNFKTKKYWKVLWFNGDIIECGITRYDYLIERKKIKYSRCFYEFSRGSEYYVEIF